MRNKKLIVIFSVVVLLTVIIIVNSVVFSVQNVYAYCYNTTDIVLETEVIDKANVKKGTSIFTLSESKIISNVENNVPDVKVINIERKFPNSVYVNYVKIEDYIKIKETTEGIASYYYFTNASKLSKSIKVMDMPTGATTDIVPITLKIKGQLTSLTNGQTFASSVAYDKVRIEIVLDTLSRLMPRQEVLEMFEFIDFNYGSVYLKTKTGVMMSIIDESNFFEKLRAATSLYESFFEDDSLAYKRQGGTIRAFNNAGKGVMVSYSTDNEYADEK